MRSTIQTVSWILHPADVARHPLVGAGDITGVTAGVAISGGGASGDVTVNVNVETATLLLSGQVFN